MLARERKIITAASSVGEGAFESVKNGLTFTVIGTTSRGVFLLTSIQSIIYLSTEPYSGPLTVILPVGEACIKEIQRGDSGMLGNGFIQFSGNIIQIDSDHVWHAPRAEKMLLSKMERHAYLRQLCLQVAQDHDGSGLGSYLHILFGTHADQSEIDSSLMENRLFPAIEETRLRLGEYQINQLARTLEQCIGLGRGLTPAGDDFIEGVILVLNRWKDILGLNEDLTQLNQTIITSVRQKTTSLSASLVEWAAHGHADERIIDVLDAIFTGTEEIKTQAEKILSIGHSSGVDLLTGIAVVISSIRFD